MLQKLIDRWIGNDRHPTLIDELKIENVGVKARAEVELKKHEELNDAFRGVDLALRGGSPMVRRKR
jgi:hypothetical protein